MIVEPKISLQNDWTKLREAVDCLGWVSTDGQLDDHPINTVHELVPKLLDAYAELWELSMNLAAAWEQERAGITTTGLVIPK